MFAIKAADNKGMLNYKAFNRELGNYEALKSSQVRVFLSLAIR